MTVCSEKVPKIETNKKRKNSSCLGSRLEWTQSHAAGKR